MESKLHSALAAIIIAIVICGILIGITDSPKEQKQPQIKPCNHLSTQEVLILNAKREMFIDKLITCSKENRDRYSDSVAKYHNLLSR